MYDINIIDDYAFEGCQVASFFNNDTSFNTIHTISHHAFDGSSFFDIPSKNGLKRVGNIVFGVDDDAEEIEFPEDTKCVLPTDIDYKNVKRAVIRNIKNVNGINKLPETIVIADTEFSKSDLHNLYQGAESTKLKQDTAYYIYKHNPGADAELEKYLKRCAKQIALRYIEENKDDELVEFIGCKLLSKSAIKQLLQVATEAGKPSIAAYLLTQIHGKPSSKFTL